MNVRRFHVFGIGAIFLSLVLQTTLCGMRGNPYRYDCQDKPKLMDMPVPGSQEGAARPQGSNDNSASIKNQPSQNNKGSEVSAAGKQDSLGQAIAQKKERASNQKDQSSGHSNAINQARKIEQEVRDQVQQNQAKNAFNHNLNVLTKWADGIDEMATTLANSERRFELFKNIETKNTYVKDLVISKVNKLNEERRAKDEIVKKSQQETRAAIERVGQRGQRAVEELSKAVDGFYKPDNFTPRIPEPVKTDPGQAAAQRLNQAANSFYQPDNFFKGVPGGGVLQREIPAIPAPRLTLADDRSRMADSLLRVSHPDAARNIAHNERMMREGFNVRDDDNILDNPQAALALGFAIATAFPPAAPLVIAGQFGLVAVKAARDYDLVGSVANGVSSLWSYAFGSNQTPAAPSPAPAPRPVQPTVPVRPAVTQPQPAPRAAQPVPAKQATPVRPAATPPSAPAPRPVQPTAPVRPAVTQPKPAPRAAQPVPVKQATPVRPAATPPSVAAPRPVQPTAPARPVATQPQPAPRAVQPVPAKQATPVRPAATPPSVAAPRPAQPTAPARPAVTQTQPVSVQSTPPAPQVAQPQTQKKAQTPSVISKRTLDEQDKNEPTAKRQCNDKSKEVVENNDVSMTDDAERRAVQEEFEALLARQLQEEEIENIEQQEMQDINDDQAREITAHRQEVFQNMHHHFDEQLAAAAHAGDAESVERYRNRLHAAQEMAEEPDLVIDWDNNFDGIFLENCEYAEFFQETRGTLLEHQLHMELCATVQQSAHQLAQHGDNPQVLALSPIVQQYAAMARYAQDQRAAFFLADYCHSLNRLSQGFVDLCDAHPVTRVGRAIAQGAVDSACNHLTYALEHPLETAVDVGILLVAPELRAAVALCRLGALAHHAYQHREEISAATQQFFNDIQNNAHHDPEWLAQNGQLFTQVYCDIFVSPQIGNKIMNTGSMRPLANGLRRQTEAVQACIRKNVNAAGQKACDGLKNILQNAGESLKTGNPQPAFAGIPGNASLRAVDDQANRAAQGLMKKTDDAAAKNAKQMDCSKIMWTPHGHKHVPQKNLSWKEIIAYTKEGGHAKYKPGINIEEFERMAWESGIPVNGEKTWKVFTATDIIGAKKGVETCHMRVEMSANTIHGHPITPAEFKKYTK